MATAVRTELTGRCRASDTKVAVRRPTRMPSMLDGSVCAAVRRVRRVAVQRVYCHGQHRD